MKRLFPILLVLCLLCPVCHAAQPPSISAASAILMDADSPKIYVYAAISARLGQLVSFALRFVWKFLMAYQKTKTAKREAI